MKVGIIGCGKISQTRHIPEYDGNEQVEIGGYFDFNKERTEELAKKFGGKVYDSVESMLADDEITAVSVCVANNAHATVSIQALNKGKHVLCEKPMAISLEECEAMVEAADKNGKLLMIGQNQRFNATHVKAKELLKDGEIGEVITFKTTFGHSGPENWGIDGKANNWFFDKTKSGMGALADLGIHKTDLIQFLLDKNVVETTAKLATLDKRDSEGNLIGVDDNAICIYQMEGGIIGTMTASWTNYGAEENSTIIYGTKGVMKIYDDPQFSIIVTKNSGERTLYEIDRMQTNDNQTKSGIIDAFVSAVVDGVETHATGKNVLSAMKATFASIESSKLGKTIKIN